MEFQWMDVLLCMSLVTQLQTVSGSRLPGKVDVIFNSSTPMNPPLRLSFHRERANWFEANLRCKEAGANLLEIPDKGTQIRVGEYLNRTLSDKISGMWIGLRQSAPRVNDYIWHKGPCTASSDTYPHGGSLCVTRGQGRLSCTPNSNVTKYDCQQLSCCWDELYHFCYIPNYSPVCSAVNRRDIRDCMPNFRRSHHDHKQSCLNQGCCWKDWPHRNPGDVAPSCFYVPSGSSYLKYANWAHKPTKGPPGVKRKCAMIAQSVDWQWMEEYCDDDNTTSGFICQQGAQIQQNKESDSESTIQVLITTSHQIDVEDDDPRLDKTSTNRETAKHTQLQYLDATSSILSSNTSNTDIVTPVNDTSVNEIGIINGNVLAIAIIGTVALLLIVVLLICILERTKRKDRRSNGYEDPPQTSTTSNMANPAFCRDEPAETRPVNYEEIEIDIQGYSVAFHNFQKNRQYSYGRNGLLSIVTEEGQNGNNTGNQSSHGSNDSNSFPLSLYDTISKTSVAVTGLSPRIGHAKRSDMETYDIPSTLPKCGGCQRNGTNLEKRSKSDPDLNEPSTMCDEEKAFSNGKLRIRNLKRNVYDHPVSPPYRAKSGAVFALGHPRFTHEQTLQKDENNGFSQHPRGTSLPVDVPMYDSPECFRYIPMDTHTVRSVPVRVISSLYEEPGDQLSRKSYENNDAPLYHNEEAFPIYSEIDNHDRPDEH